MTFAMPNNNLGPNIATFEFGSPFQDGIFENLISTNDDKNPLYVSPCPPLSRSLDWFYVIIMRVPTALDMSGIGFGQFNEEFCRHHILLGIRLERFIVGFETAPWRHEHHTSQGTLEFDRCDGRVWMHDM